MGRPVRLRKLLSADAELVSVLHSVCTEGVVVEDIDGRELFASGDLSPERGRPELVEIGGTAIARTFGPDATTAAAVIGLVAHHESTARALGAEVLDLYRQMRILIELNAALSGTGTPTGVATRLVEEAARALPGSTLAFFDRDGRLVAGSDQLADGRLDPEDPLQAPPEAVIRTVDDGCVITAPVVGASLFGYLRAHRAAGEFLAPDASLLATIAALAAPSFGRAFAHQQTLRQAERRQDELRRTVDALREELDLATTRLLATIVFTDLVGSTETQARVGDADWAKVIEAHNVEVERLLGRHGGNLIEFTGDGCFAWFDSPSRALHCMAEFREFVESLGLACRIGVHAGEVEQRGRRLSGLTVNIAARIMAQAGAGEILVSGVTAELVAHSPLVFHPRGETGLKGVPGTWTVLALA